MTTERVGALLREANWLLARTGNRGLMDDVWWERRKAWEASFDEAALAGALPLSTKPASERLARCPRCHLVLHDCVCPSVSQGAPTGTLREVAQRVVDSYETQVRGAPLEAPYLGDAIRALRAVLEQP